MCQTVAWRSSSLLAYDQGKLTRGIEKNLIDQKAGPTPLIDIWQNDLKAVQPLKRVFGSKNLEGWIGMVPVFQQFG